MTRKRVKLRKLEKNVRTRIQRCRSARKCMRENTECRYVPNTNEAHMYLDVSDTVKIITSAFFSHAMNVASKNGFFWQN